MEATQTQANYHHIEPVQTLVNDDIDTTETQANDHMETEDIGKENVS